MDKITKLLLITILIISIVNLCMMTNKKEALVALAAEDALAKDAQFQVFSGGFFFYVPSEGKIYKYNIAGRRLQTYAITELGEDFKIAY